MITFFPVLPQKNIWYGSIPASEVKSSNSSSTLKCYSVKKTHPYLLVLSHSNLRSAHLKIKKYVFSSCWCLNCTCLTNHLSQASAVPSVCLSDISVGRDYGWGSQWTQPVFHSPERVCRAGSLIKQLFLVISWMHSICWSAETFWNSPEVVPNSPRAEASAGTCSSGS